MNTFNDNPLTARCETCNKWVTKKVADYSMKNYKDVYCFTHQPDRLEKSLEPYVHNSEDHDCYEDETVIIH